MIDYLRDKGISLSLKTYGITAMAAMAQGLFASLLIGTIFEVLGQQFHVEWLVSLASFSKQSAGAAMAISIGYALQAPMLVLFSLIAIGTSAYVLGGAGGPFAVYLIAIIASESGKIVSKQTKFDLLITPAITLMIGIGSSMLFAPWIGQVVSQIGRMIMLATTLQPFLMGMILSVLMGMALTLPISSAAICASFGLTGLAGGAALIGCCVNMIGFATVSLKVNGISGWISQGLGTSMLQMANIVKKPLIWLPMIFASAILGPLGTIVFHFENFGPALTSGMGTCGLVGPIGVYTGWIQQITQGLKSSITWMDWLSLLLLCFILPAIFSYVFFLWMKKMKLIDEADYRLEV